MGGSQSTIVTTETEEERRRYRRNFRRKSVGADAAWDAHPAVDIAARLTVALERATVRAERAEAEVLALMGDDAKPSAKDEIQCSICLEKLLTDRRKRLRYHNEGVQLLQCRHVFHRGCIKTYLRSRQNQTAPCPICRTLDAACFRSIDSVRGPRLPLPTEQGERHPAWHHCLGEERARPFTEAAIALALNGVFPIEMRNLRPIPSALEITQKILTGIAEDDDV